MSSQLRSPVTLKVFNMDNPLQAAGAARGIEAGAASV
jgi:hypothetical protein